MQTVQPTTSLGDQVSHKISAWIFILVITVITTIFFISFGLSRQIFNKQIKTWNTIVPQQLLSNLIDVDHFSIEHEVEFLNSTGLFSSVVITDNKKKIIASFGSESAKDLNLIPIQDTAKVTWGFFYFKPDFYHFIFPFLIAAIIFLVIVCLAYFVIRWRIKVGLSLEFSRFNNFLSEIERVTEKLHEFYIQDAKTQITIRSSENNEQIIINRAITRLLDEIRKANHSLKVAIAAAEQRRFQEELTRTAVQVVHDIGSPIAILEAIHFSAINIPEADRVTIKNALTKIRDISNTLLRKAKQNFSENCDEKISSQMLLFIVDQIISEKRMQYGNKIKIIYDVDKSAYAIFSLVKPLELSRVLSNLINNSIEAITNDNRILIKLSATKNKSLIQIQDFGKGIPQEIINKIGQLGGSFGKVHGTGIGLNHAINTIKELNGQVELTSRKDEGTTVKITLPKCEVPKWFCDTIHVANNQVIVVIDDDEGIHTLWRKKLEEFQREYGIYISSLYFRSPAELIHWKESMPENNQILYLCDYEFIGENLNGIDLITKLQINQNSILVTNSLLEDVLARCVVENIKLVPKNIASIITFVLTEASKH